MPDLETRLREAVANRSEAFVPSPDLAERAVRRARRRERTRRRLAVVGAVASLVAVVAAAGLALRPVDDGGGEFEMQPPATTALPKDTGTAPRPPTTASDTTASTAVPLTDDDGPPPTGTIGPDTPLTMAGIGPIRVAMTLRKVEEVLGVDAVVEEYGTQGFECWRATFPGIDRLRVELGPLSEDEDDPRNFTVSFVSGRPTQAGIDVGSPVGDVSRAYGEPDQTFGLPSGGELLLYESLDRLDGYAFLHDGSTVTEVRGGASGLIVGSDEIC
jgi:hypothetical protein